MPHEDTGSAINRDLLDAYARRWGAKFVVQMIDLFVSESPARVAAAEQGLVDGDAVAIGAAAHGLKSSAGNLGAITLMNQMAELEHAVRAGHAAAALAPMVASMVEEAGRARESLLRLRAELTQ
jgi:HPt (histidine-containing phosphotransfer) domain-containing protein